MSCGLSWQCKAFVTYELGDLRREDEEEAFKRIAEEHSRLYWDVI